MVPLTERNSAGTAGPFAVRLVFQANAELKLPRSAGTDRRSRKGTGYLSETRVAESDIRLAHLGRIENIERISADAECHPVAEIDPLLHRHVKLPDSGSAQTVPRSITPGARRRCGKGSGIHPERIAIRRVSMKVKRYSRHNVRTLACASIGQRFLGLERDVEGQT